MTKLPMLDPQHLDNSMGPVSNIFSLTFTRQVSFVIRIYHELCGTPILCRKIPMVL